MRPHFWALSIFLFHFQFGFAQNLLINGDFESSTDHWEVRSTDTSYPSLPLIAGRSGNALGVNCTISKFTCQFYQSLTMSPDTLYEATFYAKGFGDFATISSPNFIFSFGAVQNSSGSWVEGSWTNPTPSDWTQFKQQAFGRGNDDNVLFAGFPSTGNFAIDDVTLVALSTSSNAGTGTSASGSAQGHPTLTGTGSFPSVSGAPPIHVISDDGPGLSRADRIALGCGLGIGIPSLILGVVAIWYSRRGAGESPKTY
ncbi:hypothetical protein BDZ94DRAFT_1050259 [Collybia nuda]|uniref:Uncharacterized protein n=1 Tax=Collybia nuda TaxID=64659 RepID=A0A9P5Y0S2_9AGAR|nr:hypothetical protein BDZ94DRAFT_1050259 [Collybia nuda]